MEQHRIAAPVLLFDGDCGFCSTSARFARRWLDRRQRYAVEPFQLTDLAFLGVTREQAEQAVQFVAADRRATSGGAAVAACLRASALPWRPLGVVLALPVVRSVVGVAYRWVAAHRYQLPGGTPACRVG